MFYSLFMVFPFMQFICRIGHLLHLEVLIYLEIALYMVKIKIQQQLSANYLYSVSTVSDHKANKLVCGCKGNSTAAIIMSTCCSTWQLQHQVTLSSTITRLFSVLSILTLPLSSPYSDKASVCIRLSPWTKIQCLAIIKRWNWGR